MSGEDFVVSSLFHSPEAGGIPSDLSCFLNRCFIARVRCLLDSTSGFLVGILTHSAVRQIPDRVRFPHPQYQSKFPSNNFIQYFMEASLDSLPSAVGKTF